MTGPEGFEVVVVGAGAAGCVVAARLWETERLAERVGEIEEAART